MKSGWITTTDWNTEDRLNTRLVYFRGHFYRNGAERILLHITADSSYKLYLNGSFVGKGPEKGDDSIQFVDTYSLSEGLLDAENVIAVEVLHVSEDHWNSNHSLFGGSFPALYMDLEADTKWCCHTARNVLFPAEEAVFSPLHIHECVKADAEYINWKKAEYKDGFWMPAAAVVPEELPLMYRKECLKPRRIPYMEFTEHSFSLPIKAVAPGSYLRFVLDAGEEMCAFLRLALYGGKDAQIRILESECYTTEQGKADRTSPENAHLEGYLDEYIAAGSCANSDPEIYAPFWFRTFRFLQIEIEAKEEPLTLASVTYLETGYPLAEKTYVRTSDPTLEKVWEISVRSLRRCMHETYMDCPFYEQLPYIMDTRSEILYTYAVSGDDRLARSAIDLFRRSQREEGLLNASYPNKNANVIPGFSVYFILMVHDHMLYFGDKVFVKEQMDAVDRILAFFDAHRKADGLVEKVGGENLKAARWSFIDWADEWVDTSGMPPAGLHGPITMESLLYLYGLEKAADLYLWLGDSEKAGKLNAQRECLKASIRRLCMNTEGLLTDGPLAPGKNHTADVSQQTQVFGILTGTLSKEEGRRNLLRTMLEKGHAQCTVAMCFYLFRALEATGLYEYTDHYWEIWRRMVRNHCSTTVESEGYARSECHAWGALALYELPTVTLGVRPAAPGYEKIEVRPVPGYMTSAEGMVHTPKGDLHVSWALRDGKPDVRICAQDEVLKRVLPGEYKIRTKKSNKEH